MCARSIHCKVRREAEHVYLNAPTANGDTPPCFIYSVIKGASLHLSCGARAANPVGMKFPPSVCVASPVH